MSDRDASVSIAAVGLACRYPDASSPDQLWENVLAQRRAFRRIPEKRLSLADYHSRDAADADRTYLQNAAVLEGWSFDRVRFRVAGSTYRATDLAHWLALEVASDALRDAGFEEGNGIPRERTGVLVGNTLTGEFSRAATLRLRWPYVRRVVADALAAGGIRTDQLEPLLSTLETRFKAPFAAPGEESLAGGLSNTIAGRICNHFDLKGGGYVVDGACSSSLLAVSNACAALRSFDLDMAIVGGVDLSLDPFELVGFARTGAFAAEDMRVFDARSAGFWPGEGCGMAVLMREADARAMGRRVRALVSGWGISSDGNGGVTRPEPGGQQRALRRAYERAGFSPSTVACFEGHGTGTAVGDATELEALASTLRESGPLPKPLSAVGSIKANIGHTKAAAGIAGFIKAVLAIEAQVLPPHTNAARPHPGIDGALRLLREPEGWPAGFPLRAGVSSFGFGGINCHVVLEGPSSAQRRPRPLPARERRLASSSQDAELFAFSAPDAAALAGAVRPLLQRAAGLSFAELTDASCASLRAARPGAVRLAVVARTPAELADRLDGAVRALTAGEKQRLDPGAGVFLSSGLEAPRIGFLFTGQGAPSNRDGGAWVRRFPEVRALYDEVALPQDGDDVATDVAQPSIVAASLAALRLLEGAGVCASLAVGHSLGELTALHWAGAFDDRALLGLARARGRAMADLGAATGAMASISAGLDAAASIAGGLEVVFAGHNGPGQTVISGDADAVDAAVARARERAVNAVRLRVSHAFHSPLVAAAALPVARHLASMSVGSPVGTVVSTVLGRPLERGDDVRELLQRQITAPVLFQEALDAAGPVDLWIEVGPGAVLSDLATRCGARLALSTEASGESVSGLLRVLGACYALGALTDFAGHVGTRFARPFDASRPPSFLENPCERAPSVAPELARAPAQPRQEAPAAAVGQQAPSSDAPTIEVVRRLVAARAELPVEAVGDEDRLLADLHLNSIAVTQIAAEAARILGAGPLAEPLDFARAAVRSIAAVLDELKRGGVKPERKVPAGVDGWVRGFEIRWVPADPLPAPAGVRGEWTVAAPPGHPVAAELRKRLCECVDGAGVVAWLPADAPGAAAEMLLHAAQAAAKLRAPARFVVVQHDQGATGFASTVHLENPALPVCAIEVPAADEKSVECITREIGSAAAGFTAVRYDGAGRRSRPRLEALGRPEQERLPFGPEDVILVTGGGKGIGAECALALAAECGAKVGIVGRSEPGKSAELAANLGRFAAAGVPVHYAAADVRDAEATRRAAGRIEEALGRVSVLLHAAGVNTPRPLAELTAEQVQETVDVKLLGLRNVIAALDPERLRAVLSFGSIIGRFGMMGEADYALANGLLTAEIERLAARRRGCRWLSLEWSAWSGAGMAERLGRVEILSRQGVEPITVRQGIATLRDLLRTGQLPLSVVIAGRVGARPPIEMEGRPIPFLRFLERTPVHYAGIEMVAECDLSAASDPGVDDHRWNGDRLLPAVLSLEALAQATHALSGLPQKVAFRNLQIGRAIVVPPNRPAKLRACALADGDGGTRLALRSEETAFQVDHVAARCTGAQSVHAPVEVRREGLASHAAVDPAKHLYGRLLFHTGRFQRVAGYQSFSATECFARLRPDAASGWFSRTLPASLLLGDPAARDAGLQAIQACLPHQRVLPVAVEEIRLEQPGVPRRFVRARERSRTGRELVYDLDLLDEGGAPVESWRGVTLRIVEDLALPERWPAALLAAYVERSVGTAAPRVAIETAGERRARSDRALEWLVGGRVQRAPDGRPTAPGSSLSAAHHDGFTLAVAGSAVAACDIEGVEAKPESVWREMIAGERFELVRLLEREAAQPLEVAATRVWTAAECVRKAGLSVATPIVLREARSDGWTFFTAGPHTLATLVTRVEGLDRALALSVLAQ